MVLLYNKHHHSRLDQAPLLPSGQHRRQDCTVASNAVKWDGGEKTDARQQQQQPQQQQPQYLIGNTSAAAPQQQSLSSSTSAATPPTPQQHISGNISAAAGRCIANDHDPTQAGGFAASRDRVEMAAPCRVGLPERSRSQTVYS